MTDSSPIMWTWEGDVLRPASPFWARKADQEFVIGERYRLVQEDDRSHKTHAHFFACVNEAWKNLPDDLAARFRNSEALRKYALIRSGHCDSQVFSLSSPEIAQTVAAAMRSLDEYAVIDVHGNVINLFVAKSQSYKAMNKKEFAQSKEDVLRVISEMLGTSIEQIGQAAKEAA